MKKLLFLFTFASQSFLGLAQSIVSGTVQLEDQTDPSGTAVVFLATSTSAQSDTVYVDSAGAYSTTLANGRYDVSYSKSGYLTSRLEDLVVFSDTVLSAVTLQIQAVNWVDLDGELPNGMVLEAGVPYRIQNSITVPLGNTLQTQPGVTLTFSEGASMYIYADIAFEGTFENPIRFLGENGAQWSLLYTQGYIDESSEGFSIDFEYCTFQHVNQIQCDISGDTFRHCTFYNTPILYSSGFFAGIGPGLVLDHCKVFGSQGVRTGTRELRVSIYDTEFINVTASVASGFWVANDTAYAVKGAQLHGIYRNTFTGYNTAMKDVSMSGVIERNLFIGNEYALDFDNYLRSIQVFNNLFLDNDYALTYPSKVVGDVNSNIFLGSTYDFNITDASEENMAIEYNLFDEKDSIFNTEGDHVAIALVGDPLLTENRGEPSDTYYNIVGDPELDFSYKGYLSQGITSLSSLLLDRGDPNRSDEDGSPLDIGPFSYQNQGPLAVTIIPIDPNTVPYEASQVTFSWYTTTDQDEYNDGQAIRYTLHLQGQDSVHSLPIGTDTSHQMVLAETFAENTQVIWWVTASDGYTSSSDSQTSTVTLSNTAAGSFDIVSPTEGEMLTQGEAITLVWTQAYDTDAVEYSVFLMSDEVDTIMVTLDTTLTLTGLPEGDYQLLVEASDGALTTQSSEVSFTIAMPTGLQMPTEQWQVYPNPAKDRVTVNWENPGLWTVQLRSFTGTLLHQEVVQGTQVQLGTEAFARGVYWVVLTNQNTGARGTQTVILRD